jgi:hypothetical protein
MAYTYSKLATYTVGSGGIKSVDFLNIPQNYTDLIIKYSSRETTAQAYGDLVMRFNGDSGTNYGILFLRGSGTGSGSQTGSYSGIYLGSGVGNSATANTFGNGEVYIPNYTSSTYKSASGDSVGENNASLAYASIGASVWNNTSPITSISITGYYGDTIMQYSTFHLYGIKAEL